MTGRLCSPLLRLSSHILLEKSQRVWAWVLVFAAFSSGDWESHGVHIRSWPCAWLYWLYAQSVDESVAVWIVLVICLIKPACESGEFIRALWTLQTITRESLNGLALSVWCSVLCVFSREKGEVVPFVCYEVNSEFQIKLIQYKFAFCSNCTWRFWSASVCRLRSGEIHESQDFMKVSGQMWESGRKWALLCRTFFSFFAEY